ncbi:MAG: hypothetical protein KKH88_03660 [Nanoarchaeota archaeon]|nr:hypothetical protein [Nanoarchaeota archaeon]
MFRQQPMNSKEVNRVLKQLKEQFDIDFPKDYYFFKNNKGRIFLISKRLKDINLDKVRVNELGLYFATIEKDGIRLSIEGSQLLKDAKKNVIELTEEQFLEWLKGFDIELEDEREGYMIVKYKNYYCGSGKLKEKKLNNFVPKSRRILK